MYIAIIDREILLVEAISSCSSLHRFGSKSLWIMKIILQPIVAVKSLVL